MIKEVLKNVIKELIHTEANYKRDNDKVIHKSLFSPFVPTFLDTYSLFWKSFNTMVVYHLKTVQISDFNFFDIDFMNFPTIDKKEFFEKLMHLFEKTLKKNKKYKIVKRYKFLQFYKMISYFISYKYKDIEINFVVSLLCDNQSFSIKLYIPVIVFKDNKYDIITNLFNEYIDEISNYILNHIHINDNVHDIINRINNFIKVYKDKGIGKYVILLHGPPGTGKTFIANMIKSILSLKYRNLYVSEIVKDKLTAVLKQTMRDELEPREIKNNSFDMYQYNIRYDERIYFEIIDEFDSLISVKDDKSLLSRYNTGKIKQVLDQIEGIVILISNHIEDLDEAVVRDDRINLKVKIDENFYTIEEKKNIVLSYLKKHKINYKNVKNEIDNIDYTLLSNAINQCKNIIYDYIGKQV